MVPHYLFSDPAVVVFAETQHTQDSGANIPSGPTGFPAGMGYCACRNTALQIQEPTTLQVIYTTGSPAGMGYCACRNKALQIQGGQETGRHVDSPALSPKFQRTRRCDILHNCGGAGAFFTVTSPVEKNLQHNFSCKDEFTERHLE